MELEVRLFALLREAQGQDRIHIDVPAGVTAAELKTRLAADFPRLAGHLQSARVAMEMQFIPETAIIQHPGEVALIPPVSGG